jgi:hypothetical protein
MNHYTKSIWVLTLGMAALVIAFLSPLFGILFGIAAIILGKKTMSEAKSKMAYAGFWIGIAADIPADYLQMIPWNPIHHS